MGARAGKGQHSPGVAIGLLPSNGRPRSASGYEASCLGDR